MTDTRHEFDVDRDRCVCGGVVVHFERPNPDETGEGCEVEGRPWPWTLVPDDPYDPDFDPDGAYVYRRRPEGPYRALVVAAEPGEVRLDDGTVRNQIERWYVLVLIERPGTRYFSDGSGEPPYVDDVDLGVRGSLDEAKAAADRWIRDAVDAEEKAEAEIRRAEAEHAEIVADDLRSYHSGDTYGAAVDPHDR